METWEWIVVAVGAGALVLLVASTLAVRRRRRARLRERFGSEYDRAVMDSGRRAAERRLSEAAETREELTLRALPPVARDRHLEDWRHAEAQFVSDPRDAVRSAQRVVVRVLEERGYPGEAGVEERIAFVAADHPDAAERLRRSYELLEAADGELRTESLRRAMLDLRMVLEDVLEREPVAS